MSNLIYREQTKQKKHPTRVSFVFEYANSSKHFFERFRLPTEALAKVGRKRVSRNAHWVGSGFGIENKSLPQHLRRRLRAAN